MYQVDIKSVAAGKYPTKGNRIGAFVINNQPKGYSPASRVPRRTRMTTSSRQFRTKPEARVRQPHDMAIVDMKIFVLIFLTKMFAGSSAGKEGLGHYIS